MAVVWASPSVPPPPPSAHRRFFPHTSTWEGSDGSLWSLSDPSSGIILLADGVQGLHFPAWDRFTSTSPALSGARFRGTRVTSREVTWAVHVYSDETSAAWLDLDRAFWHSFSPDETGTWTVSDETGRARRLRCRLASSGDYSYQFLPTAKGWATYPVNLVADDPFWLGDPVSRSWAAGEPVPFFDAGGSPPFHISQASTFGDAVVENPGDVAAWPVWTIEGPSSNTSVTIDGGTVGVPDLASGDTLVIDTDPAVATALLNGVDVSGTVNPWDPRPIPAGGAVAVHIEMSSLSSLSVEFTPRYYRGI